MQYRNKLQKPGIYEIYCQSNGKSYIGQAKNVYCRLAGHSGKLKNNKHENNYLQNTFNKYGEKNFVFKCLEYLDSDDSILLKEREAFWIGAFKTMIHERGFNIQDPNESRSKNKKNKKVFIIFNPKGEKFTTNNLSEFCRQHFNNSRSAHSNLSKVLRGELYSYKEWQCYTQENCPKKWISVKDFEISKVKKNSKSLVNTSCYIYHRPTKIFLGKKNLESFCEENKLDYNKAIKCLKEKTKMQAKYSLDGYYIYSAHNFTSEQDVKDSFIYIFINPNNNKFEVEKEDVEQFCLDNDLLQLLESLVLI